MESSLTGTGFLINTQFSLFRILQEKHWLPQENDGLSLESSHMSGPLIEVFLALYSL